MSAEVDVARMVDRALSPSARRERKAVGVFPEIERDRDIGRTHNHRNALIGHKKRELMDVCRIGVVDRVLSPAERLRTSRPWTASRQRFRVARLGSAM